jgi:hypothetical protein
VERAVAKSTRAQNLPLLVDDDTALATIAGIIDRAHGRDERSFHINNQPPSRGR